jgi:hypothetical protein
VKLTQCFIYSFDFKAFQFEPLHHQISNVKSLTITFIPLTFFYKISSLPLIPNLKKKKIKLKKTRDILVFVGVN